MEGSVFGTDRERVGRGEEREAIGKLDWVGECAGWDGVTGAACLEKAIDARQCRSKILVLNTATTSWRKK